MADYLALNILIRKQLVRKYQFVLQPSNNHMQQPLSHLKRGVMQYQIRLNPVLLEKPSVESGSPLRLQVCQNFVLAARLAVYIEIWQAIFRIWQIARFLIFFCHNWSNFKIFLENGKKKMFKHCFQSVFTTTLAPNLIDNQSINFIKGIKNHMDL
ncbi:Hypothetical_protein [Hexamita inflata]|uniref:Hypothetical_protein n=1 Tax=Hexamita inflata TaxID=28002 RepID=A0AA86VI91_9EUKA|nr:Hypothetical protein HINF_LOCUS55113 [Hexamita inflata]